MGSDRVHPFKKFLTQKDYKMKRIFTIVAILMGFGLSAFGQSTQMDLSIKYDETLQRYEVYSRPATSSSFNLGPSQISIVFPEDMTDSPITLASNNLTSVNGGTWADNSQIYATNPPTNDFHGFGSSGAPIVLTAGEELLMFHFTLPGGCVEGLRIFDSSIDPGSSAAGMEGSDFENSFADAFFIEHYNTVYNNSGTSCTVPCNVTAPILSIN